MGELLPPARAESLRSLLLASGKNSLEDTWQRFQAEFPQPGQCFRALCSLLQWADLSSMPAFAQRVTAYYLAARPYDWSRLSTFPFLEAFVQVGGDESAPHEDRAMLQALLNKGPSALRAASPADLAARLTSEPPTLLPLSALAAQYGVDLSTLEPKVGAHGNRDAASTSLDPSTAAGPSVTPAEKQPPPPAASISALQGLLANAQAKPLPPGPQKEFLDTLDAWPHIVAHIELTPDHLPALTEHNNMVAVELLLRLIDTASPAVPDYLDQLVRMDLSVHSLEVVKKLTSSASLPRDFVQAYIASCISACETIEQRSLQNRLVRMVCVFLQYLIRTKVVDDVAVQHELHAFCITFSRVREATSLYRLLLTYQEQGSAAQGPSAP